MAIEDQDESAASTDNGQVEEVDPSDPLDDEFYFDGPYMVFTEAYHLRRGYCCQSGCRHCPYGFVKLTPAL